MAPVSERDSGRWRVAAEARAAGTRFLAWLLLALATGASAQTPDARIEQLEHELAIVRARMEALAEEIAGLRRAQDAAPAARAQAERATAGAQSSPRVRFGGQYRANAYRSANDDGRDAQTATRVRIRQNLDFSPDDRLATHLQLELGHTTDNVTTTIASSRGNTVAVRHALIDYRFESGVGVQAGIVPLADRFGDTLFSADWDYNPVALAIEAPIGPWSIRGFAANLRESIGTGGESEANDDTVHYQIDAVLPFGDAGRFVVGAGYMSATPGAAPPFDDGAHLGGGLGVEWTTRGGLRLAGFVLGSHTDRTLTGTARDASGLALKLSAEVALGPGVAGLMLTHASGAGDGSGFLPFMALAGTYGYWGWTGLLTVQGATDTGVDFDAVNVSNNGYGLTSVQGRYRWRMGAALDGYVAAGWFGNTEASGRSDSVGTDLLLMGSWRLTGRLALDFGAALAWIDDGASAYFLARPDGTPPAFSAAAGSERDRQVLFTRLQAEF